MRHLILAVLMCLAVPAFAQELSQPAPQAPSIFSAIKSSLGSHLGVGAVAAYDFVAKDWSRPYAVGPVAQWVVNDGLVISGGAKYVLNNENKNRWRSEVQVMIPLYGADRLR